MERDSSILSLFFALISFGVLNRRRKSAYFINCEENSLNKRRNSAYYQKNSENGGLFFNITGKNPLIYPEMSLILNLTGNFPLISRDLLTEAESTASVIYFHSNSAPLIRFTPRIFARSSTSASTALSFVFASIMKSTFWPMPRSISSNGRMKSGST